MIELLTAEIQYLFPGRRYLTLSPRYILHCSAIVRERLLYEVLKSGFNIPVHLNGKQYDPSEVITTELDMPDLGHFKIITDMEQGYKIEKSE